MAFLHAIATATPAVSIDEMDSMALANNLVSLTTDQERTTNAIYRKSGVGQRHSVILDEPSGPVESRQSFYNQAGSGDPDGPSMRDRMEMYEQKAPPLARQSADVALARAGVRTDAIGNLVTVSCTGFAAPGWDVALVRDVLHPGVERTHVGFMGCHGSFNGLRVASSLTRSSSAPVLMTSTELCTIHHRYQWEPETTVANALFADGSGSVVLSPERDGAVARYIGSQSRLQPGTEQDMSWKLGNHGFVMTLSIEVPIVIGRELRPWLDDWLATHDLSVGDVAGWAIHPGGPRILAVAAETLKLNRHDLRFSYDVLRENGNMSSSTVLFILERMIGEVQGPVVALGFGPGLTFEAMLLELL